VLYSGCSRGKAATADPASCRVQGAGFPAPKFFRCGPSEVLGFRKGRNLGAQRAGKDAAARGTPLSSVRLVSAAGAHGNLQLGKMSVSMLPRASASARRSSAGVFVRSVTPGSGMTRNLQTPVRRPCFSNLDAPAFWVVRKRSLSQVRQCDSIVGKSGSASAS
jgi:hypothetical protein